MRVLLVHSGFEVSTSSVGDGFAHAMRKMGITVFEYDTYPVVEAAKRFLKIEELYSKRRFYYHNIQEVVSQPLLNYAMDIDPWLVLVIHGGYIHNSAVRNLNRLGFLTHLYLTDEPQQTDVSSVYSQFYKSVSTNDKATLHKHQNPNNKVCYLPTGFDEMLYRPYKPLKDRTIDIFIGGSLYLERMNFIEKIKDTLLKYNTVIAGRGPVDAQTHKRYKFQDKKLNDIFKEGTYTLPQLLEYKRNARIILDIPRNENYCVYGYANKDGIKATSVSPRIYETPMCGSILLTGDWRSSLYDVYDKDKVITFKDEKECEDKINEIMSNPEKYLDTIEYQKNEVATKHLYRNRVNELLRITKELGIDRSPCRSLYDIGKFNFSILQSNFEVMNKKIEETYDDTWQKNFSNNEEQLIPENDFGQLAGKKSGTCVIVANSPSLEYTLPKLEFWMERNNKNFDIIAVNSAINILENTKDCKPDYSVIIHPTDDQTKHFDTITKPESTLLLGSICSKNVADKWKEIGGKVLWFHTNIPAYKKNLELISRKKLAVVGANTNVVYSATAIALAMGYRKIIYIGIDCGYVDGYKYYGEPAKWESIISRGVVVKKDVFTGQPVVTDDILLTFKETLGQIFNGCVGPTFINASERGLLDHPNLKKMTLEEALKE